MLGSNTFCQGVRRRGDTVARSVPVGSLFGPADFFGIKDEVNSWCRFTVGSGFAGVVLCFRICVLVRVILSGGGGGKGGGLQKITTLLAAKGFTGHVWLFPPELVHLGDICPWTWKAVGYFNRPSHEAVREMMLWTTSISLGDPGRIRLPCKYQQTMVSHGVQVVQDFVHLQ